MDLATANALFYLLEREILTEVTGVLSTGKESTIYLGLTKDKREVAIKAYRTKTLDFKKVLVESALPYISDIFNLSR